MARLVCLKRKESKVSDRIIENLNSKIDNEFKLTFSSKNSQPSEESFSSELPTGISATTLDSPIKY